MLWVLKLLLNNGLLNNKVYYITVFLYNFYALDIVHYDISETVFALLNIRFCTKTNNVCSYFVFNFH